MGKHKAQDHIAKAIKDLSKAVDLMGDDLKKASAEDLKEGARIAKEQYKNDPMLGDALGLLKKRGINL